MDKQEQIREIERQVRSLKESPLYDVRERNDYSPVIGEGDLDARIMMIGEAPGKQEAQTGRPFVGSAGRMLDKLLESVGLRREEVYITNVVKDRPPENRDPTVKEIELYAPFLVRQIEIIKPRVLVTLGRFATDFALGHFDLPKKGKKMRDLHGRILPTETSFGDLSVVPLYHPAAAFYNQDLERAIREDFEILEQFI